MALINGKAIKTTIKIFIKDYGREPTFEEIRELLMGRSLGKKEEIKK